MSKTIVAFANAFIKHSVTSDPVVQALTLRIEPEHAWIITGPLGSGKTTILDTIRGKNWVDPKSVQHPFLQKKLWPTDVIKMLDSRVTTTGGSAYYSERYHSRREDDSSLREWLSMGRKAENTDELVMDAAQRLGLVELLDASTMNLSNGQSKRATIARVLLDEPEVLLLDEPYVGLDVRARENLNNVLGHLHKSGDTKLVLAIRPMDKIPPWATHVLWMNSDGTTRYVGPAPEILPELEADLSTRVAHIKAEQEAYGSGTGEVLVDLKNVNVAYWGKDVLKQVDWTIRAGEKWLLSGSNGSGKTTLLAMILGDHPKAYANEIYLFGRRRSTRDGRSVFELQREMGHTSPELHKHFPLYRTAKQCIQSAFGESFHPPRQLDASQTQKVNDVVAYFNLEQHLDSKMSDLSPALQRLFLLVRALVKKPKIVVLDEPFAGMDDSMIHRAKMYINEEVKGDQAVLFVTHYEDEVPASVTRVLTLDKGRVIDVK
ncbi:Uncharacterized ABC transporter ATP-binding protein C323.04 [Taphrina deformans PYCC 5710]|uniref:Uncharacterized ABC transporter ATP-binding protein C323.04 n=1 Tax=Taphrina deformans (strain PYCC 5710 / ATCC 11124 / CBS 356.35 / IMI 108563 / JCM 9778 / NBRC 8474) TaxID=1097556 RepID=R4XAE5_TAPDE|nr:Uncharacterized ABC transporter ATP-binding protein C323.04 [Taphrina deformans PYCC 5710]|eukprot:CCG81244.1 Uncharacterized ABC transporter ATP-binding protein C323.04 [Taphrina deformans PYCC 5710]